MLSLLSLRFQLILILSLVFPVFVSCSESDDFSSSVCQWNGDYYPLTLPGGADYTGSDGIYNYWFQPCGRVQYPKCQQLFNSNCSGCAIPRGDSSDSAIQPLCLTNYQSIRWGTMNWDSSLGVVQGFADFTQNIYLDVYFWCRSPAPNPKVQTANLFVQSNTNSGGLTMTFDTISKGACPH